MINNSKHQIISSNIAPNPIEVKFWLDTNSNTLKTYKDGKWEAMSGGGSNSSSSEDSKFLDITKILTGEIEPDEEGWYDFSETEWLKAKNSKGHISHVMLNTPEITQLMIILISIYQVSDGYWTLMMNGSSGEINTGFSLTFDSDHPNKIYFRSIKS